MNEPREALERARAAAAAARAEGKYPEQALGATPENSEEISSAKLFEWALIEPDLTEVRSTRPLGAPITAFKRLLLRLLYQYHAELLAQQTRFNIHLVRRVDALAERLEELERRVGGEP